MRKTNIFMMITITLALLAGAAFGQIKNVSAQNNGPVGVVVAYVPGQSITIVDQQGNQSEFTLASSLRILPPGRGNSLAVGSFVTVIAPASLSAGKQIAVSIVVHPQVPNGWNIPSMSATPLPTGTADGTQTATPTGTLLTETVTVTLTETPTNVATVTLTETPTPPMTPEPTFTAVETPTPTPPGGGTGPTNITFIEWLRSLFQ